MTIAYKTADYILELVIETIDYLFVLEYADAESRPEGSFLEVDGWKFLPDEDFYAYYALSNTEENVAAIKELYKAAEEAWYLLAIAQDPPPPPIPGPTGPQGPQGTINLIPITDPINIDYSINQGVDYFINMAGLEQSITITLPEVPIPGESYIFSCNDGSSNDTKIISINSFDATTLHAFNNADGAPAYLNIIWNGVSWAVMSKSLPS